MDYNNDACFGRFGNFKNTIEEMNQHIHRPFNFDLILDDMYKTSTKVMVIGGGISGQACARWMEKDGKIVEVLDSRKLKNKKISNSNILIKTGIKFPLKDSCFDQIDLLVVSPGLSPHISKKSDLAPMLEVAKKRNIPVVTEVDLFGVANNRRIEKLKIAAFSNMGRKSRIPIIAITGTNGKTSVVRLITKLLKSVGIDAQHAGNIGPSLLEAFLEREITNKMPDFWVLELSSFQLALSSQFSPTFATILNFSEDHLDWHLSIEEYFSSKLKVFGIPKPTAKAFICRDDKLLLDRVYNYFKSDQIDINNITFGTDLPKNHNCFGINKSGTFCFKNSKKKNSFFEFPLSTNDINLKGDHNFSNISCCLAIVNEVSTNIQKIAKVLKNHIGEAHRLEVIFSKDGINFINDSKATNIAATISAVRSFEEPLILLIGGLTKDQNFNLLSQALDLRPINLIVFGKDVASICESLKSYNLTYEKVNSLKEAVDLANKTAKKMIKSSKIRNMQINILLSPACSSLDMYQSYQHRGDEFKKLVLCDFNGEKIC